MVWGVFSFNGTIALQVVHGCFNGSWQCRGVAAGIPPD